MAARLLEQYQLDLWLVPSLRNTTEKLLFREGVGGRDGGGVTAKGKGDKNVLKLIMVMRIC